MKWLPKLVCLLSVLMLTSCHAHVSDTFVVKEGLEYRFSDFLEHIDQFPYDAPPSRQEIILNNYARLRLGMQQAEVLATLGKPDAEFLNYNMTKSNLYLGSSWGYYLHRDEPELANARLDKAIFVSFDTDQRLRSVAPSNVDTLTPIGSPFPNDR
jgi:hypothetical protein